IYTIASGALPQLYQAWLDFCMPLAEYVGGLTPRAGRITGQLIENGYPERADDALHGIAMAKILMVPVFICMLAGWFSAAHPSPVFVSCTRWTHIKIWLRIFIGLAMAFALAMLFVWLMAIKGGERIGDEFRNAGFLAKQSQYHRGNFAMMADLWGLFVISMILSMGAMGLAGMRPFLFTIVTQKPEGIQDFAALKAWQKKVADNNSGDNADTADKEETPPN
ncbi:MAG: hypothetical protein ACR2PR_11270, partial [Pseudohongiellaceae bacterium]